MKIDGRLKRQYIRNQYGLNIYVWRKKDRTYDVGINGTSLHYKCASKDDAEFTITSLIFAKK